MDKERKEFIITKIEENKKINDELLKKKIETAITIGFISLAVLVNIFVIISSKLADESFINRLFAYISSVICSFGIYANIVTYKRVKDIINSIQFENKNLNNEIKADELELKLGLK